MLEFVKASGLSFLSRFIQLCVVSLLWLGLDVFAQSWVATSGGALPNDSLASNYFQYLATKLTTGIAYGTHNGSEVGDIYVPNYNGKPNPANYTNRPAVIVVHGGGGTSGTRTETRSVQASQLLAAHGYVAFNIDYTLGAVYPNEILDWRLAVRYLRAHAATYGIDPHHIGIMGGSYGGFCSAFMSGITNGQRTLWPDSNARYNNISLDTYGSDPLNSYDGNIQCAFDMYGPTEQNTSGNAGGTYSSPTATTLSNSSAIYYVHPTSAPLMIAHGTADTTVNLSQSQTLTNYLGRNNVYYFFARIPGAAHTFCIYDTGKGGTWPLNGASGTIDLRKDAMDFFDKWLLAANNPPAIQVPPVNQTGCTGYPAGFTVTASGTAPLSYQWSGPAGLIAGATNATYIINSLAANDAGNYSVLITNPYGSISSGAATLGVNNQNPPNVINDLTNQTVAAGQSASFSITATGDALNYQWFLNGAAIPNATNAVYSLASAANADAGNYQAIIYNVCDSQSSATAVLTVNGPPTITANPASITVCSGDSATFIATAIGAAPLFYQWFGPVGAIIGATANSLVLTNLSVANSGTYYLMVTNAFGSVTSSNVSLAVSANQDIAFVSQPANATVSAGSSASFSVSVAGGGNYTYLWLKNDYDAILNAVATNATLTFTNLSTADSGNFYHCLVGNDCSIFSSADATLTVLSTNVAGGSVVISEVNGYCGKTASIFTNDYVVLKNTGGTSQSLGGWSLQHQKSSVWQAPFALPNATIPAGGYYLIKCYNDGGTLRGTTALPAPDASTPQTSAWNLSTSSAESVALVNTTNVLSGFITNFSQATAATVVDLVGFVAASSSNSFIGSGAAPVSTSTGSAQRKGSGCQNTPDNNLDFFLAMPSPLNSASPANSCGGGLASGPAIVGQPAATLSAATGNNVALTVVASGSGTLNYQWRMGGINLNDAGNVSGTATATLNLNAATISNSGNYDVVISSLYGAITSSVSVVSIVIAPPSITQQPQNQSVTLAGTVTFTVVAAGSSPFGYQWQQAAGNLMDGGIISGAGTASLTLNGVQAAQFTNYWVVITNNYGAITSSVAALNQLFAAAVVVKGNNATALNIGSSWTGGIVPGSASVAQWDSTSISTAIHSADVGGFASWYGINIVGWSANTGSTITDTAGTNVVTLGAGGITSSNLTHSFTYYPGLALSAPQTWNWSAAGAPKLMLNGPVNNNGYPLTITGTGSGGVFLGGVLSGGGNLIYSGTTNLTLSAANSYSGSTFINSGTLTLSGAASIFNTPSINIATGASLDASGLTGTFNLGAAQSLNLGAGTLLKGNVNVGSGSLVLAGNGSPAVIAGGTLTLLAGSQITVTVSGSPLGAGTYLLLATNAAGGVGGTLPSGVLVNGAGLAPGMVASLQVNGAQLYLLVAMGYTVFNALFDAGSGFFGGENVMFTNTSGGKYYVWSSPDPSAPVSGWGLEGLMSEQPLNNGTGTSRYSINLIPAASPVYYVAANANLGPYAASQSLTWLTTDDFEAFYMHSANLPMSTNGAFLFPIQPVITQSPHALAVLAGQAASFSVAATGPGVGYQWIFNNTMISGASLPVLGWTNVAANQAGSYWVVVTNAYGSATSSVAPLSISMSPYLMIQAGNGGVLQLGASSVTGLTYVVVSATNLMAPTWLPVMTNSTGVSGAIRYAPAPGSPSQFFRVLFP